MLGVVTLVIVAGFTLTAYSLSAPRSTLKNIIGRSEPKRPWNIGDLIGRRPVSEGAGPAPRKDKSNAPPDGTVTAQLVKSLAMSARSGKRTTRTTLAIVGFSLLGRYHSRFLFRGRVRSTRIPIRVGWLRADL